MYHYKAQCYIRSYGSWLLPLHNIIQNFEHGNEARPTVVFQVQLLQLVDELGNTVVLGNLHISTQNQTHAAMTGKQQNCTKQATK